VVNVGNDGEISDVLAIHSGVPIGGWQIS
jgi:hypothetical protein